MAGETKKQRVDRELIELLNELRVALPGVQVLFAFLLILPFQQGFTSVSEIARDVYFAGLATSAAAIAFLIAPASYHRLNHRRGTAEKEQMLLTSSKLAIVGTFFLAAGIACSVFVVADVLFGPLFALGAGIAVAVLIVALWYILPLTRRGSGADESESEE